MKNFFKSLFAISALALLTSAPVNANGCPSNTVWNGYNCIAPPGGGEGGSNTNNNTNNNTNGAVAGAVGVGVGVGIGHGGNSTATGGQGGAGGSAIATGLGGQGGNATGGNATVGDVAGGAASVGNVTSGSTSGVTGSGNSRSVSGVTGSGNSSVRGSGNSNNRNQASNVNNIDASTRIRQSANTAIAPGLGGYGMQNCFGDTNPSGSFTAAMQGLLFGASAGSQKASNVCSMYAIGGERAALAYLASMDPNAHKALLAAGLITTPTRVVSQQTYIVTSTPEVVQVAPRQVISSTREVTIMVTPGAFTSCIMVGANAQVEPKTADAKAACAVKYPNARRVR